MEANPIRGISQLTLARPTTLSIFEAPDTNMSFW